MNRFIIILAISFSSAVSLLAQDKFSISLRPYIQNLGKDGVTIIWETNRPGTGWVEIAPDDSSHFYAEDRPKFYDSSMGIRRIGTLHKVDITGLEPGTTYRYRVISQEVTRAEFSKTYYGETASTAIFKASPITFTTLDESIDSFRFIIVNDIHQNSGLFHDLMKTGDMATADFAFFNGDMVSSMNEENTVRDYLLQYAVESFASEKPFRINRGNHETRGQYAGSFMDYFPSRTGLPYYTFTFGDTFFILIDSGEDKPDSDIEYYGRADFDRYREKEAEWLESVVGSGEFQSARHRIAFMHMPPVGDRSWHGPNEAARLFLPILNKAGIDVMFCGHTHNYRFWKAGEGGNDFPIIVNDNETVVSVEVSGKGIGVKITGRDGKTVETMRFGE